jgi:uroporphyrinogen-III decarboxylase
MGFYINPEKMSKEEWLLENTSPITVIDACNLLENPVKEELPVIWVNNGPFTAAAIAYDLKELKDFLNPNDVRPKKLFKAKIKDLKMYVLMVILQN